MQCKEPTHFHIDQSGKLVGCYKACISLLTSWQFWIGVTISFPLEHFLWEHVWPFYILTNAFGL